MEFDLKHFAVVVLVLLHLKLLIKKDMESKLIYIVVGLFFAFCTLYYNVYRLTGVLPFSGNSIEEILLANTEAGLYYRKDLWKNLSTEAFDLASKMVEIEQYTRLSVKECLSHPWFSMKQSKKVLKSTLINLKNFKLECVTPIEKAKEITPTSPGFRTSSPIFARRTSIDNCPITSFNDLLSESPLYTGMEENFTNCSKKALSKAVSESKLHEPSKSNTTYNPFLSVTEDIKEPKSVRVNSNLDDIDEIPSERPIKRGRAKSFNNEYFFDSNEVRIFPSIKKFKEMPKRTFRKHNQTNKEQKTIKSSNALEGRKYFETIYKGSIKETKDSETTPRNDLSLKLNKK